MRKRISLFLATLVTLVALPAATFAAVGQTDVNGTVTKNGNPVKGAIVSVTCVSTTKQAHTDATGAYRVPFTLKKCPAGSTVTVSASKSGDGSGSNSGTVSPDNTDKLNVAIVDVSLVPEFGLIGLTGAVVIGGGAFMVMRRRHLSGHQA